MKRPGVIAYIPVQEIARGRKGCPCPMPECGKWSTLDPLTGNLEQPAGCGHAYGSESFSSSELSYILFTRTVE